MQATNPQYLDWASREIIENIAHQSERQKERLEQLLWNIEAVEKKQPLRRLSLPPSAEQRSDYRDSSAEIIEDEVYDVLSDLDCFEEYAKQPMDSVKECIVAIGEAAFTAGIRGELADYAEMKDGARLALECFLEATEHVRMLESRFR